MAEHSKVCEECGKEFIATRSDKRFCSAICRTNANRKSKGDVVHLVDGGDVPLQPSHQPKSRKLDGDLMAEILDELRSIKNIILNQGERLLTVEGTCKELEISKITFGRLQSEGVIKVHRFGGKGTTGRGRKGFILFSELVDVLRSDEFSKVEQNRLSDGEGSENRR